jgi:hypothetical protein
MKLGSKLLKAQITLGNKNYSSHTIGNRPTPFMASMNPKLFAGSRQIKSPLEK